MKRGLAVAVLAGVLGVGVATHAQIHGTPPSVTSLGGGKTFFNPPGVPASVTSLGPNGFNNGPRFSTVTRFGHPPRNFAGARPFRRHFNSVLVPYYVPYYPYDEAPQYAQQQPPVVVVVDRDGARGAEADDSRYGEHRFGEDRQARDQAAAQPAPAPAPVEEQDPTVLVFRDGHQQEVRNYAIVGAILYSLDAKSRRKIPLADLDLDATRKLNDERGVDFTLPKT